MLSATCLCGGVQIEVSGKVGPLVYCHCSRCRKSSGTAFSANVNVRRRYWRFVAGEALIREFESAPGVYRAFCSRCGSPVYSRWDADPEMLRLRLGLVDGDPGRRAIAHFFVGSKAAWFEIADPLPQFEGGPADHEAELAEGVGLRPVPRDNEASRLPVSVKGVVIRGGRVVLLENERDEWELPGGKLEPSEPPQVCVAREIAEELRLQVKAEALLDTWVYSIAPEVRVLIVTYGCTETADVEAVLSHEHKRLAWFPLSQVPELRMPEGYKASIRAWALALGIAG